MMKVIHGEKEEYTVCEYTYGKCLLKQRHPVLKKYLDREMAIKEHVFGQLFNIRTVKVLPEEWKN